MPGMAAGSDGGTIAEFIGLGPGGQGARLARQGYATNYGVLEFLGKHGESMEKQWESDV